MKDKDKDKEDYRYSAPAAVQGHAGSQGQGQGIGTGTGIGLSGLEGGLAKLGLGMAKREGYEGISSQGQGQGQGGDGSYYEPRRSVPAPATAKANEQAVGMGHRPQRSLSPPRYRQTNYENAPYSTSYPSSSSSQPQPQPQPQPLPYQPIQSNQTPYSQQTFSYPSMPDPKDYKRPPQLHRDPKTAAKDVMNSLLPASLQVGRREKGQEVASYTWDQYGGAAPPVPARPGQGVGMGHRKWDSLDSEGSAMSEPELGRRGRYDYPSVGGMGMGTRMPTPMPVAIPTPPIGYLVPPSKPPPHQSTSSPSNATTASTNVSTQRTSSLRVLRIPSSTIPTFLRLSQKNTSSKIETCALLLGTIRERYDPVLRVGTGMEELLVEMLLVPKQRGTGDTCVMEEEEGVIGVQLERGLIALGWVSALSIWVMICW